MPPPGNSPSDRARTVATDDCPLHPALVEYVCSHLPRRLIAQHYGISARTLTAWVRRAGLEPRKSGKPRFVEPRPEQKRFLRLVGSVPLAQLAKRAGCSKQYLSKLAKRWADWIRAQQQARSQLPAVQGGSRSSLAQLRRELLAETGN